MNDLKSELASLRIDKTPPVTSSGSPWPKVIVALLLVLVAIGAYELLAPKAVAVETIRPNVTSSAARSAGAPVLTASGYVVARRKAVVSAKIQGRLAELRVEEGSRVAIGDILARLESADQEAQVGRARAQVQRSEADLAENERLLRQAQSLADDDVLSEDALEAAQSRVKIAQAALAQSLADLAFADAQFQNTVIRAPFTGVVVKKMAEVGESVAPIPPGVNLSTSSGAVVALADLDTLELEVDVSESNVAKLVDAQPAEVTIEAFPDKRYRAVLRQVIPTADRTKATVQVKVTILDKDQSLKPEMSGKVTFLEPTAAPATAAAASSSPVVSISESAVVDRSGKKVVFEVVDGRVRQRAVVTGSSQEGRIVVKEGLTGQETLVARPSEDLKEGDRVKVKAAS